MNVILFARMVSIAVGAAIIWGTLLSEVPPPSPPTGGDKVMHALAFAALVFPVALAEPRAWPVMSFTAVIFGGAIELIQPFVGRNAEWLDFWADALGVGVAVVLALSIRRLLRRVWLGSP